MLSQFCISVFMQFTLSLHAATDPVPLFDLPTCVRTALSQHPGLALAQKAVLVGDRRQSASTAGLFPAISLKAEQTRGKADQPAGESSFLQRLYGFQATQPLFYGGKLWLDRRRAALGSEVARLQLEKQRLELRHQVTEAFWKVVAVEKSLGIYKTVQAGLLEDLEKAARHELSAAKSARIELLSTRVQTRESQALIAETEEELLQAKLALLDAMGYGAWIPFQVPLEIPAGSVDVREEDALNLFRLNQPELKIAARVADSAALAGRAAASVYYPRVDLNGFYGRSGAAFIETESLRYQEDWNAGLRASWALMGNTARYSAFNERTSPKLGESSRTETQNQSLSVTWGDALSAHVEALDGKRAMEEEQWQFERTRRDLEQAVRLAVKRVQLARLRHESAAAKADEAAQGLKDTRALLQDDRAHLGDMAQARSRAALAEAARAQAACQYQIAVSALNKAVGLADYYRVPVNP